MLIFRVGPQGNYNDPLFLPSIVEYKIYLHPPQGDSTDYYVYMGKHQHSVVTQDIIVNSFSAMLHFCNCEHDRPHWDYYFGIGDSFKFSMLNSKLFIMLNTWGHNKSGSWVIEVYVVIITYFLPIYLPFFISHFIKRNVDSGKNIDQEFKLTVNSVFATFSLYWPTFIFWLTYEMERKFLFIWQGYAEDQFI